MRCQNLIETTWRGDRRHLRSCKRPAVDGMIFCDTCSRAIDGEIQRLLIVTLPKLLGGKIFAPQPVRVPYREPPRFPTKFTR